MLEEKKETRTDIKSKKLEEEIEEAIDELFVPSVTDADGEGVDDLSLQKPSSPEESRKESEGNEEPPDFESSIDAAIDELFVEAPPSESEGELVDGLDENPEAKGESPFDASETQEEAGGTITETKESVASPEEITAELLDSLKEKLLSLDWEISSANIRALEKVLSELPPEVDSDPKNASVVRMMQAVLKYLATVRYSASPLSIQFLRDAMKTLEKFLVSQDIEEEEAKKSIGKLVNKFRRLKHEARKYQKVSREKPFERMEGLAGKPVSPEVIPDALRQLEMFKNDLREIANCRKRIKNNVKRMENLLSRYERLQSVFDRKPALARVANYFGETTKGLSEELEGVYDTTEILQSLLSRLDRSVQGHRELLLKKGPSESEKMAPAEEKTPEEKEIGDLDLKEQEDGKLPEEPSQIKEESSAEAERTLVYPVQEEPVEEPSAVSDEVALTQKDKSAEEAEKAKTVEIEKAEELEGISSEEEMVHEDEGEAQVEGAELPELEISEEDEPPEIEPEIGIAEGELVGEVPPLGGMEEKKEAEEPPVETAPEESEIDIEKKSVTSAFEPVFLATIAGSVLAIPGRFVAKVYSLPKRKIQLINSKGYAFLKDLKPFFRSIKHEIAGPLAQKSPKELKSIKASVAKPNLSSLGKTEDDFSDKLQGLVLLSDGEKHVFLCSEEAVSQRPTEVSSYEMVGPTTEGTSGMATVDGEFEVPVLNVETLLDQAE